MAIELIRLLGILSFTFAWLAYDHYPPWVNFHSESLAFLGVGLLAVSRCIKGKAAPYGAPRLLWVVLIVSLVPWAQYLSGVSLFAGDALVTCLYLYALAVAIWVGYDYALESDNADDVLTGIFFMLWFAALVSAAIGLVQWLHLQEALGMYLVQTNVADRAMGNLGQPNQLATLMLIGIASLAWSFEKKSIGTVGLLAGVSFLTLVLVLSQSRAAMLSALAISGFMLWKSLSCETRLRPSYIFAWIVSYGLGLIALPYLQDFLLLGAGRSMNVAVDVARLTIWKQVLVGISHAPWFGYGWNQTPTAHSFGSIVVPGSLPYTNAHNIVLDLVAWNGIPIGLLLTGLCVWWFVSRISRISHVNAVYAMAALLPVLVHSLVEYPFAYSYFLLMSGLLIGIVEASHAGKKTITMKVRWIAASLAIWFVFGICIVYEYLKIEKDFVVVRFENLRVGQTPTEYTAPDVVLLSHLGAMLDAYRQKATPNMTPGSLESLRKASLRFSRGSLNLRYAVALGLNGFPAEATRQFAIIQGMYGPRYYQAAVSSMRELQAEKYPELSQVVTP